MAKKNPYLKYENKDERCTYPFEPMPVGYCWGYAEQVDGGRKVNCKNCECWEETKW